jgi:hypothetical protein
MHCEVLMDSMEVYTPYSTQERNIFEGRGVILFYPQHVHQY